MLYSKRRWQETIWREWRYCQDEEYGQYLFKLVADDQVSYGARFSLILLSAISGMSIGLIIGVPLTLKWSILQQLAWAGIVVGVVRGYFVGRQLSWQDWINRLEANTPTSSPTRLAAGAALLGLCGFFVFGPLFWVIMIGGFWTMGGLIAWLNKGLDERDDFEPEDRQWWFWWRRRPYLSEVRAALQEACTESTAARAIWAEPLSRLAAIETQPASAPDLIDALLSQDWMERFTARYALVTLGQDAITLLQTLAENDEFPLQPTVQWLVQNIEQGTSATVQPQEQ